MSFYADIKNGHLPQWKIANLKSYYFEKLKNWKIGYLKKCKVFILGIKGTFLFALCH